MKSPRSARLDIQLTEVQHAIQQVILLKKDYPDLKIVIQGGHAAPLVSPQSISLR